VFDNCLIISGEIVKAVKRTVSPAGIPHFQFAMEHVSEQIEADLPRRVYCRIRVLASGQALERQIQILELGVQVKVTGFIHSHKASNGISHIILHAQQIDRIN
jgi:primosomal replication protein N